MRRASARSGRALGQVFTLLGGSGAAHAISLAASLVLSRLYAPEHFGVLAVFSSLVALVSTAATGRYELAVILPAKEDEAWQLVVLALLVALPVVASTAVAVALWGDVLAVRAGDANLASWAWLLPPAVLLTVWINALSSWANRNQAFGALALNRVAQTGLTAVSSIGLGVLGWTSPGLLLGSVLGLAAGALMLFSGSASRWMALGVDHGALRSLAIRYRDFPRINLPHAVLDALQSSLVLALLGAAYGAAELGAYAFALRIARAPLAMLGTSVGQVFQQRAARLASADADLGALALRTVRHLGGLAVPTLLVLFWAPDLFAFIFGAQWRGAGEQARVLAPWLVMNFITTPLSQLPLILGRQAPAFGFGVAYQLALVVPIAVGAWLGLPVLQTLAWQSGAASLVLLAYGHWLLRIARGAA